jgi:hypothetical protein
MMLQGIHGTVLDSSSPEYKQRCLLYNKLFKKCPTLFVVCLNTMDVQTAVKYAAVAHLSLTVRSGGHHPAGIALRDYALSIDISQMKTLVINSDAREVTVQFGVLAAELMSIIQQYKLWFPMPNDPSVGISGYTLGGGIGSGSRLFGAAADSLIRADLVLADGSLLTVDDNNYPELLWAIKGAGRHFGVVTSMTLKLHPIPEELFFMQASMLFEQWGEAVELYRKFEPTWPNDSELQLIVRHDRTHGDLSVKLHGIHFGNYSSGVSVMGPLMQHVKEMGGNTTAFMSPPEVCCMNPHAHNSNLCCFATTIFVSELTDELLSTLKGLVLSNPCPESVLHIIPKVPSLQQNAFGFRNCYCIAIQSSWDPTLSGDQIGYIKYGQVTQGVMDKFAKGYYGNVTMITENHQLKGCFEDATWEKLLELKRRYDPGNIFPELE